MLMINLIVPIIGMIETALRKGRRGNAYNCRSDGFSGASPLSEGGPLSEPFAAAGPAFAGQGRHGLIR